MELASLTGEELTSLAPNATEIKNILESGTTRSKFNKAITEELQARGYKGILYSPHRYGEYELRMFNPKDVLLTDLRRKGETGVKGLTYGRNLVDTTKFEAGSPWKELSTGPHKKMVDTWKSATDIPETTGSLRDIYKDVDLEGLAREILLRSESPRKMK